MQWILVHSHHHNLILEPFHLPQRNPVSTGCHSPFPSLQPLEITNLLSVFMGLPILYISYKWNYTLCGVFCVWLLTLSMLLRFIHVVGCVTTSFLFMAQEHSIYGYTTFCLSIHQLIYMLHVGMCLGVELLGPIITLFNIWSVTKLFSKAAVPFYIPASNTCQFQFFHSLSTFVIISLKSYAYLSGCEVLYYLTVGF